MNNEKRPARRAGWRVALVALVAVFAVAACDFEVTNPGPVPDAQLSDPGAHAGVVQGAKFSLSVALWQTSYHGSEVAHEITRAGRNFCCPKVPARVGEMTRQVLANDTWNVSHRARFTAEDASRRFAEVDGINMSSYGPHAEARLLSGFANRVLGENMCMAVFDGGSPEPNARYWERAEAAFTEAISVGQAAGLSNVVTAAYAGRAQVRGAGLGDWSGAASDAQQVPRDFTYQAIYTSAESSQYNIMFDLGSGDPWVDWTVWGSDFETYYDETGDPRVPYVDTGRSDTPLGHPLFSQRKFQSRSDDINLASGREMLLIRAEAALRNNDVTGAMALINDLRSDLVSDHTGQPLPPLTATNAEEAWTHLKNERRWELWLESRRMGDLRRWIADGTPGAQESVSDRIRLCFPVAQSEVNTNENIDDTWEDPVNPTYTGG
jgi:starch-binding outer membrane protein, SusD/RagB family